MASFARTVYVTPPGGTSLRWPDRDQSDSLDYTVDLSAYLADASSVLAGNPVISSIPPNLTFAQTSLTTNTATWTIAGGSLTAPITDYQISIVFLTAANTSLDVTVYMRTGDYESSGGASQVPAIPGAIASVCGLTGTITATQLLYALGISAGDVSDLTAPATAPFGTTPGSVADGGVVKSLGTSLASTAQQVSNKTIVGGRFDTATGSLAIETGDGELTTILGVFPGAGGVPLNAGSVSTTGLFTIADANGVVWQQQLTASSVTPPTTNYAAYFAAIPSSTTPPTTPGTIWRDGNLFAITAGSASSSDAVATYFAAAPNTRPPASGAPWINGGLIAITPGSAVSSDAVATFQAALPTSLPTAPGTLWNDGGLLATT